LRCQNKTAHNSAFLMEVSVHRLPVFIFLGIVLSGCSPAPSQETSTPAASPSPGAAPAPAAPGRVTAGWMVTEGVNAPESVYVDTASGYVFVSNIGGMPGDRDGNGNIMKLTPDGKVVSAAWVTGLNAPKGLRSHNGTLWTADIDEVVAIDIASGKVLSKLKIDGAQFLNDVAVGDDGTVYVSDMLASKIYAVKDGKASVFAEGDSIEYPNGLLVDGDRLLVGGWGKPEPDFSTKVPGHLFALDLKTKQKTLITPKPFGNIDGLELDGRGGYIITDYNKGLLIDVTSTGESRTLKEFKAGTADLAFVPTGNIAIVPHMNENKIVAYDISDVLKDNK
jgi:outer membrane protein assembly factor BamB